MSPAEDSSLCLSGDRRATRHTPRTWEELTIRLLSRHQSMHSTLFPWPLRVRLVFMTNWPRASTRSATCRTGGARSVRLGLGTGQGVRWPLRGPRVFFCLSCLLPRTLLGSCSLWGRHCFPKHFLCTQCVRENMVHIYIFKKKNLLQ